MSGSKPCGGPPVPASATSTSTPAARSRSRRNANSSPFVSSVPISRTVGHQRYSTVSRAPGLGGAQHRVADLGGAVAVLERRAVRRDVGVVADRRQEVVDLVHERVLPADHVALRPPVLPERMVGLGHEHGAEAGVALGVLQLVEPLEVERSEPLEPLISHVKRFLRPWQKRVASIVPTAPFVEAHDRLDGVVDVAARLERRVCADTAAISPTR